MSACVATRGPRPTLPSCPYAICYTLAVRRADPPAARDAQIAGIESRDARQVLPRGAEAAVAVVDQMQALRAYTVRQRQFTG